MEDDVRRALLAYFERDIGRPPIGARERVVAGLDASSRRPRRPYAAWAAAVAALLIAVVVVATLLAVRGLHPRTQPARQNPVPVPRSGAAIAYDQDRGVLVMFGGTVNGTTPLGDTWTWDGARWTERHPAVSPPLSAFGPQNTPGPGPKPQSFPGLLMADDPASGSLVLYGIPGGTWTWDGRSWHRFASAPPQRGTNDAAAMAYDPSSAAVLLYLMPAGASGQTWRWDGATWTELHPRTTPDVVMGSLAFDGRRLLLFGTPFGPVRGQFVTRTWEWDGTDWSLLAPAVALATGYTFTAAYDQARGRIVVYLSYPGGGPETWLWDGATWSRVHPQHEPPAGSGAAAWYDSRTREVALYDGTATATATAAGDIWTWDGTDWRSTEGTGP
ncbi:MAG TPA: hypothetical protein VE953_00790 [Terriglobales bacterium]|nr:hypothetical protein [Terriglobales bacterium]